VILVVTGDLARQAVDAVLRPADATLAAVGDAAARLDALGGDRFATQRRTGTPLETGAAVVTGGGDLPVAFVLHVVVADERGPAGPDRIRRGLVSAWQRAGDWGLRRLATPLIGTDGLLSVAESVGLLLETLPETAELSIVVDAAQREVVESLVGRKT
jgi:O-acetyl-ADP-ribose deacetylase (regulator of RNase III)